MTACVGATCLALALAWEPGNPTTADVTPTVKPEDELADGDGIYGRFDGNLELTALIGAETTPQAVGGNIGAAVHYFSTAGVFVSYSNFFGSDDARWKSQLSVGVDLRPLFIPRMSQNLEAGPGTLDLLLDSTSLGLGAFWASPGGGDFGDARGLEASLGLALPLVGAAAGPHLGARGLLRFVDPGSESAEARGAVLVTLSWHAFTNVPL